MDHLPLAGLQLRKTDIKCIHNLDRQILGQEPWGRSRSIWVNNINVTLKGKFYKDGRCMDMAYDDIH
jgi:hypothetical protein